MVAKKSAKTASTTASTGQSRLTGAFGISKRGVDGVGKDLKNATAALPTTNIKDNSKVEGIFTKPGLHSDEPKLEVRELISKQESSEKRKSQTEPDLQESLTPLESEKPEYQQFLHSLVKDRKSKPIHQDEYNTAEKILRQFDMTAAYGPTAGLSRLERWNRAEKLGLNPPSLVKEILETKEGSSDSKYSQSYLYGYV